MIRRFLVGVRFEERDLRANLGEDYLRYEQQVPRFVPRVRRGSHLEPTG